jgi:glycosyltransferase involved in cell wall biosynthesis
MVVEIFIPTYNGMYILPMTIEHYQERLPGCTINIMDDNSTDETREFCESKGCVVTKVSYEESNPHLRGYEPALMKDLRNNCWKNSEAEWIMVVDQDELIDVRLEDFDSLKDFDVVKVKGYDMWGLGETDPKKFTYGRMHPWYCKPSMFRRSLGEINWIGGNHTAYPPEHARWARYHFNMYHYPERNFSREKFIEYLSRSVPEEISGPHYDQETDMKRLKKVR